MSNSPNVLLDTSAVIDSEEFDGRAIVARVRCNYADLAQSAHKWASGMPGDNCLLTSEDLQAGHVDRSIRSSATCSSLDG